MKQKNQFIINATNNILSPLNAIIGAIDILKIKQKDDEHKQEINFIEQSSATLLAKVTNILTYLEIKESANSYNYSTCLLAEIIHSALTSSKNSKNINSMVSINFDNQTSNNVYVKTDVEKLKLALKNIIDNAIIYTEQGHVTVTLKTLEEAEEYMQYQIIVEDSGIGMSQVRLNSITETLASSGAAISSKLSGLGLPISKVILEKLNASLSIKSVEKQGSQVCIDIKMDKTKI